ncbi:MAG: dTDP-4-dehydrorhamnose reductase [Saprospiraceae bacterium]|nr:dTDP-4-dehydrorhamnose reductase [Saprospiraceae bacterium]
MIILVTGSNGQLGRSFKSLQPDFPDYDFIFTDVDELDITDHKAVSEFFRVVNPDFCINAAAYTAVDKAETEKELCASINKTGPKNLALACQKSDCILIHISTDYVYDCCDNEILSENSPVSPKSWYAISKLEGEREIINILKNHIIIRTSWLYSEFGHNFVKTIIRLAKERKELKVVNDQIGSPTYAPDLALTILNIINNSCNFGIYNYSNEGFISWYDFATEIIKIKNLECSLMPINTSDYPTPAPRPKNSRLSKEKIINAFHIAIPQWFESLKICLERI